MTAAGGPGRLRKRFPESSTANVYQDGQGHLVLQVDLGKTCNVNHVSLNWEAAAAASYQIQTSLDGTNWSAPVTHNPSTSEHQDIVVSGAARYVRVTGLIRQSAYGYSLYDLKVWSTDGGTSTTPPTTPPTSTPPSGGTLLSPGHPATASSSGNSSFTPDKAFDGDPGTRWSSAPSAPPSTATPWGNSASTEADPTSAAAAGVTPAAASAPPGPATSTRSSRAEPARGRDSVRPRLRGRPARGGETDRRSDRSGLPPQQGLARPEGAPARGIPKGSKIMQFTTPLSYDDVLEQSFTLDDVPGVLWTPEGADGPRPLILLGHGGGQHKKAPGIVARAKRFVAAGFAAVALDAPHQGDRPPSAEFTRSAADNRARMLAGDEVAPQLAALHTSLAEQAVPEWQAVLTALQELDHVGPGPVGYWGVSMGAGLGIPLVAADPRIRAAVVGLVGILGLADDAARITVPVEFLLQWHDEFVPRDQGLALFDAVGSAEKTLHANSGKHAELPRFEVDSAVHFFQRHLV